MKHFFNRTIKIGKLTVSIIPYEVVILYVGRSRIFIKTIRFNRYLPYKKIAFSTAGVLAAFFIITVSVSVIAKGRDYRGDDELKDTLLNSSQYVSPDPDFELEIKQHVVKRGESLSSIARKYGVSVDTVCGSNNLKSYDVISEGMVLKIPNKDGILYKMVKGSSIVNIAETYRIPLQKILKHNDIHNPDFIASGTVLFIPDAKPQNIVVGFLWPTRTKYVTCGYGWRRNPFNWSEKEFHMGLDIRAVYDTVRASKYGQVSFAGWLGGYGKAIIIAHPGGMKTLYAHLSSIIVRSGQYVKQGQTIGKSGNTGRSTGAHLHFEIMSKGKHQNPYRYLARKK